MVYWDIHTVYWDIQTVYYGILRYRDCILRNYGILRYTDCILRNYGILRYRDCILRNYGILRYTDYDTTAVPVGDGGHRSWGGYQTQSTLCTVYHRGHRRKTCAFQQSFQPSCDPSQLEPVGEVYGCVCEVCVMCERWGWWPPLTPSPTSHSWSWHKMQQRSVVRWKLRKTSPQTLWSGTRWAGVTTLTSHTSHTPQTHPHTLHLQAQAEKDRKMAETIAEMRKSFFCDLCDKQYTKYSEFDNHLNSYDHHHRQVQQYIIVCIY